MININKYFNKAWFGGALLFLAISIIAAIVIFSLEDEEKTLPNYTTIIGTALSIISLALTWVNVWALKRESEQMARKLDASIANFSKLNTSHDLNKCIRYIGEIHEHLGGKKIEIAIIKLRELKQMIVKITTEEHLKDLFKGNGFKNQLINLGTNISALQENLHHQGKSPDMMIIFNNLEDLSSLCIQLETQIKSEKRNAN